MTFERWVHAATLTALVVVLGALAWVVTKNAQDAKVIDSAVCTVRIIK